MRLINLLYQFEMRTILVPWTPEVCLFVLNFATKQGLLINYLFFVKTKTEQEELILSLEREEAEQSVLWRVGYSFNFA